MASATPETPLSKKWTAQELNRSDLTPLEASKLLVYTLPANVDPTKMQLAYGRRAIPKLVTEIPEGDLIKQQKSLVFLAELLHNPLNITQALKKDIVKLCLDLIKSNDLTIKQKATECLAVISCHAVGRTVLVHHDALFFLSPLFQDSCDLVRSNVHKVFEKVTCQEAGVLNLLQFSLVPQLVKRLPEERMDIQIMILNTLYQCIRMGGAQYMPEVPIKCDAMGAFTRILKKEVVAETRVAAAKCIMMLSFYKVCKTIACQGETIGILIHMLSDMKSPVRAAAAGALMSITIDCEAKKLFVRENAVQTLMELLDDLNESVVLNVIKVITNVAEDYRGRFELHSCVKKLEGFSIHAKNPQIRDVAKRAIAVITWRP
ncbi:armadillo-type protein [Obelidium mucronatum]|nr:armadillo-type protein [Obelidium mucronatum]